MADTESLGSRDVLFIEGVDAIAILKKSVKARVC
jgi:hypothetical protein